MKKIFFKGKSGGFWRISVVLFTLLLLAACGSNSGNEEKKESQTKNMVNIGVTNSLDTINPLLGGGKEVDKYAIGLEFLPLVELDKDLNYVGQLASSITTEDNQTFTVKIDEDAKWSDGQDITADDVIFSVLRTTSPEVGNTNVYSYANIKGFDENGNSPSGAESIEGLVKVDDKTVQFLATTKLSLDSFENTFGRYIFTVPKHILKDVPADELSTYDWFNKPDVVSGPYKLTDYDSETFLSFKSNQKYWKSVPKIKKMNIKILDSSQLYAGLQSGEIDFVQQTMGSIAQDDYANVQKLENVTSVLDEPITNQMVFLNTGTIKDKRVRQAILYAVDRKKIVKDLLDGNGEVADGFLSSYSPYFDKSITPTKYDLDKAKKLVEDSGWDSTQTLTFLVNSGDQTFVQAADIIVASLKEIGINAKVESVNLSTLTTRAGDHDYDILAVQYTMAPIDPYPDISWLINSEGDWPQYQNSSINEQFEKVQGASSQDEVAALYSRVTKTLQEDVPFFSAYFVRSLGAVNKELENAEPHTYGSFNNIEKWEWKTSD